MTKEEMKELNGLAAGMGLYDDRNPCKRAVILGKAIKELEQEPCNDAISRQAAQTKIKSICDKYGLSYEDGERKVSTGGSAYALGHAFDDLPPVTPQIKTVQYENSDILDKIRSEIEFEVDNRTNMICAEDVFEIIDKYIAETKETEEERNR